MSGGLPKPKIKRIYVAPRMESTVYANSIGEIADLPESVRDAIRGDDEHKLFDKWLSENYQKDV